MNERPFEKVRRKMVAARIEFMGQLAKFSKEELEQQWNEQEWSALQLANHLYISDGLVLEQLHLVQEQDNPEIIDTGKEAPARTHSAEPPVSLEAVLAGMAARREELFEYLASLPDEAWERPLIHPEWGPRKFYQIVNVLPIHDHIHTQQLVAMKESLMQRQV